MRLDLRFTQRPPYAIWCEAVVGFIHEGSFVVKENMAGVDKKTSAYLRALNRRGFCTAKMGETLLLAGEDRLRAEKVILKGLGPKEEITFDVFLAQAGDVALRLRSLGINNFVVKIPLLFAWELYHEQVRRAVQEMMDPFLAQLEDEDDIVTAVFSVERPLLEEIAEVEASLRDYFRDVVSFSLVTESAVNDGEI